MKHKISILIIVLIIALFSFPTLKAQENLSVTEKLALTAKVWGFLKYYHPDVANGNYNWDEELFKIIPKIESSQTNESFSNILNNWIDSLGIITKCVKCTEKSSKNYINKNFDLSWTQNSKYFEPNLSQKLKYIENNRYQGKPYYIKNTDTVWTVQIQNEPEYPNFDWKNKNLRLLALFRYWNIVEYFYPYKYLTDQKWEDVLKEMIPKFTNAQTELEYNLVSLELVVKIDDSHAAFSTPVLNDYFGLYWIPAKFTIIDNKAVITGFYDESLAAKDDLRIGDVISKANGTSIKSIFNKQYKYISASNPSVKIRNSSYAIFNGNSDTISIEYTRDNEINTKTIHRYYNSEFKNEKKPEKWKIFEKNIGYINMGVLEMDDVATTMMKLMNTKAIIFDIRNYPKSSIHHIAAYLNKVPKYFITLTMPDIKYPGKFYIAETQTCGTKSGEKYKGKVIVLVNEITQSQAEYSCMCFQTVEGAKIIGSQTAGADGNVTYFKFPGNNKTVFTGMGVYYPDGKETQRIGIVPDIEVKPTIQGMQNGKDEVLEKAIDYINNSK